MREAEAKIMQSMSELLSSYSERLSVLGVTFRQPEIEVWKSDEPNYTSEISASILKDGDIDDVLEFHVYENGMLTATFEETMEWLKEQLDDLVKTYSSR